MSNETGDKQRLLIVDDSKVIRVTARKILQGHFETAEAVDGNNAWEILNSEAPFSLVITDLTMPGMDGYELLEKIRASHNPQISKLPVIVITGSNDSEPTKQRATEAGATDFIGKPFDAEHLLARTTAYASAFETEQTLTESNMALEDQAQVDPVSGLPNETAFVERGGQMLSYASRHESTLALFSIDIDGYGELHETGGDNFTAGAVKTLAGVLNNCLRQEDVAARVGSSRFTLLLPGLSNTGIRNLADRIIGDLGKAAQTSDITPFTVSIGVAAPESIGTATLADLLSLSQQNLQAAARQGGNCAVFTQPDDTDASPAVPELALEPTMPAESSATSEPPAAEPPPEDAVSALELTLEPIEEPAPEAEEIVARAPAEFEATEIAIEAMPDLEQVGTADQETTAMGGFDADDIVITAPSEYAEDAPADAGTLVAERASAITTAADSETPPTDEMDVEPAAPRRGFFARLFSIFRRK